MSKLEITMNTPLSRRALLAISTAAAATAAVPAAAMVAPNPDAELLRLDREHDLAYARALGVGEGLGPLDDEDSDEACDDVRDLEFEIREIPAQTLAGLAVKARLASVYFEPDPVDPLMMGALKSLVSNILRMANASPKHPIAEPVRPRTTEEV